MGFLDRVETTRKILPPRIVIHGKGGVGKTTFGASIPNCVLMPVEDGVGALQVATLPQPRSYNDVMSQLEELGERDHQYRALVIDTIDKIEPLIWDHTCLQEPGRVKKDSIESWGYGKGYVMADRYWLEFFHTLDGLRAKGLTIVVLSHNETKTVADPELGPFDMVQPKLHRRGCSLLYEWADLVGYLTLERATADVGEGRTVRTSATTGRRLLHCHDTGAFVAKNRYRLTTSIVIPEHEGFQPLRQAIVDSLREEKKEKAA